MESDQSGWGRGGGGRTAILCVEAPTVEPEKMFLLIQPFHNTFSYVCSKRFEKNSILHIRSQLCYCIVTDEVFLVFILQINVTEGRLW